MAHIIAIANAKGGTAKTTTVFNLGYALHKSGKQVLLIDADSQGTLTDEIGFDPDKLEHNHKTLADALSTNASLARVVVDHKPPFIGSYELLDILEQHLVRNNTPHTLLRNKIKALRNIYAYILIDCGPKFSEIMYHILTAANYVIIPVKPDHKSSRGIVAMPT